MKKICYMSITCVLLLTLTACAPKINNGSSNKIPSVSPTPTPIYEPFSLYFPDPENMILIKETQELNIAPELTREEIILSALQKGPKSEHLKAPITTNAKVNSIKTISGLCTINFSETFLTASSDSNDTRMLNLQSIVHSLCELDTIEQVKFNIGNDTAIVLDHQIDLSQPLSPDNSLLKTTNK